jgi:hypothetical protein
MAAMSNRSKRIPPAIEALGRGRPADIRRLTDEHLQTLHDLALITFLEVQQEMAKRGMHSGIACHRTAPPAEAARRFPFG